MNIIVTKTKDLITPSIQKQLRIMKDPRPALKALATVLVAQAIRAFNDPSARPSPWAALSATTLRQRKKEGRGSAPLKRTGTLARSPRMTSLTRRSVSIGSDRPYAQYQQLGTKHIPARPFFPFTKEGRLTPRAKILATAALNRVLALRK